MVDIRDIFGREIAEYKVIYGAYICGILGREITKYTVIYGAYIHGILGRETTKYTVIYGAYIHGIFGREIMKYTVIYGFCQPYVKVVASSENELFEVLGSMLANIINLD